MSTPNPVVTEPTFPIPRTGSPLDPPPEYDRFREEGPLKKVTMWDGRHAWLVTRRDDVKAVLASPNVSASPIKPGYPFLTPAHANRLAPAYGTRATKWLGQAKSLADLGQCFGATLTEAEVRYLMSSEWACTADDIVWRRSKLGLRLSSAEIAAIDDWIEAHGAPERPLLEAGGRT